MYESQPKKSKEYELEIIWHSYVKQVATTFSFVLFLQSYLQTSPARERVSVWLMQNALTTHLVPLIALVFVTQVILFTVVAACPEDHRAIPAEIAIKYGDFGIVAYFNLCARIPLKNFALLVGYT